MRSRWAHQAELESLRGAVAQALEGQLPPGAAPPAQPAPPPGDTRPPPRQARCLIPFTFKELSCAQPPHRHTAGVCMPLKVQLAVDTFPP